MLKKIIHGSILNKVTSSDLLEERAKCNFDQKELWNIFYSRPEENAERAQVEFDIANDPKLALTHKYYEWTP
jgi:hypothetical protein